MGLAVRSSRRSKKSSDPGSVRRIRSAVTLLELLAVILIISLLVGILVPSLTHARKSAKRVVCMTNLHGLGIAVDGYQVENRDILPWEGYAEGDRPIRHLGKWSDTSQWFNALPKFGGDPMYCEMQAGDAAGIKPLPKDGDQFILVCPESAPAAPGPQDDLVTDGYFMLWGLSDNNTLDRRKTYWSYGYNTKLDAGIEDRHTHEQVSLTSIPRTGETPILVEKLMRPDEFRPPFATSVGQSAVSWKEFTTRHDGGGLLLFLDSHVKYFTRKELTGAPNAPNDYNQPGKVIWNPGGPAY